MEYGAVYLALNRALEFGIDEVQIFSDSMLVVEQLNQRWKIREAGLLVIAKDIVALAAEFQHVAINHVPRERNPRADWLCNKAMDAYQTSRGKKARAHAPVIRTEWIANREKSIRYSNNIGKSKLSLAPAVKGRG